MKLGQWIGLGAVLLVFGAMALRLSHLDRSASDRSASESALAVASETVVPDSRAARAADQRADWTDGPIPVDVWRDPPLEMRPTARWWWPGGSVEGPVLRDQLARIAQAGFGAVEVQPLLLGLGESDVAGDPRLRTVGLESFGRALAEAAGAASALGLGFDLTLGSGWPGGLPTAKENAERQLLMAQADVVGPVRFTGPLPPAPDQSYRRAVEWWRSISRPPSRSS